MYQMNESFKVYRHTPESTSSDAVHSILKFVIYQEFFFEAKIPTLHSQINISCYISKLKLKHGLMCLLAQRAVMIVSNTQWERNG